MSILLYPTRRDLETEVVKGPVILIERFVQADTTQRFFTSVYANHMTVDRKEHATLGEAVDAAITRNRDGVRLNKPASFCPADPTATALDMGVAGPPSEAAVPPAPGDTER